MDSFMGYSAGASVSPEHSKSAKHCKSPRSPESHVHVRTKSAPRSAQPISVDAESSLYKPEPEKVDHHVLQDTDKPTIYKSSSEPRPKHMVIVVLEAHLVDLPLPLDIQPCTYEVTRYCQTTQDQVLSRICNATVVVAVTLKFDTEILSVKSTPKLKLISYAASGVDGVDLGACTRRGITVCNASGACAAAVSEHALGLYFALRRRIVQTHLAVQANQWTERSVLNGMMKGGDGQYPMSCKEEVMGLVGYGQLGKAIATLGRNIGMKVLISERKGAPKCRPDRTAFQDVLKASTVLIIVVPKTDATIAMFSLSEFRLMRSDALVVNVARGGIVDEVSLIDALQKDRIAGAAMDVFEREPATSDTTWLISGPASKLNLITTPHTAFTGDLTETNLQSMAKENIEQWYRGWPIRVKSSTDTL